MGDLTTEQSDIIVVCPSLRYLFDTVCQAGEGLIDAAYADALEENPQAYIIDIETDGQLPSDVIYFIPWKPHSDENLLRKSLQKFISIAMEKAAYDGYRRIAFPAIGCGEYGCSVNLVAQIFIEEIHRLLTTYSISVSIVIEPSKKAIYHAFQAQIDRLYITQQELNYSGISSDIGKGKLEIKMGDITREKVDVIIVSSSSINLKSAIMEAAGDDIQSFYDDELNYNQCSLLIPTPPGDLPCETIFFIKWKPNDDEAILQQSIVDFVSNAIQNMISYGFNSIAFPAMGCGDYGCSVVLVVKTLIKEVKNQLLKRKLPLKVIFVVQPDSVNVYDEFCKQALKSSEGVDIIALCQFPDTWIHSANDRKRFPVSPNTDEYMSVFQDFYQEMSNMDICVIKIERIQNERWYAQYLAHCQEFQKRMKRNTEKRLYHGCSEKAANLIIEDCFNRSFAGVNGTVYGVGVYFSSKPSYSHTYTRPNADGERCMFVSRVLIGKSTLGNSSMKTPPLGFDTTTDNKHIFVTYHDAQAYAEYLITYIRDRQ
ncbi:unnamed protein product [Rotaria sp. Silwood2]|nr:unnamed protein product [Rotaria sp. Silwood2]CAF4033627.1 unnamed protein product [Rotaria sp. Silwood2]